MSDELASLWAELDVLERYIGDHVDIREAAKAVKLKIARLEAEADPWHRSKSAVEYFRGFAPHKQAEHDVVAYVDHLTAENDRLAARVAELEDASDPILDPARVLLTAIGILASEKEFRASASISDAMFRNGLSATNPYPLKGGNSDGE